MGVPVGLIVRCTALIVYLYTWNVYINTEFTGRFDIRLRYGSYYEFLTNLSFLLSIIVNVFLVIGELLPKGKFSLIFDNLAGYGPGEKCKLNSH